MTFEWLWLIPILFTLVLTHEFGHFLTARLFNVTVHEFGIGFPPKARVLFVRNGVEYTLNWLPIGGFVRMEGEDGVSKDPNAFNRKPAWQRLIILASGSVVNLLTALIIFIVLSLGGQDMPNYRTGIYSVEPNGPAAQAGIQPGDIVVKANGKPIQRNEELTQEIVLNANYPVPLVIDRNGQTINLSVVPRSNPAPGQGATGVVLFPVFDRVTLSKVDHKGESYKLGLRDGDVISEIDGKVVANSYAVAKALLGKDTVKVVVNRESGPVTFVGVQVSEDLILATFPAGVTLPGLQPNDLIQAVNDNKVRNRYQLDQALAASQPVTLTILTQKGNTQTVAFNPATAPVSLDSVLANQPAWFADVPLVPPTTHQDYSIPQAVGAGFARVGDVVGSTFQTFVALFRGSAPISALSGPAGIGKLTGDVARGGGFVGLLSLMGFLGINLFFVNMFPFPALDGGRFLFVLIEMLAFGRRIPARVEELVNVVGFLLLLLFIGYVTFNDVIKIWG